MMDSFEKHRRQNLRTSILQVLNVARPYAAAETLILQTLGDVQEDCGPGELRRELDYLEDKIIVRIRDRKASIWQVELTSYGVDVVEGAVDLPPGLDPFH